MGAEDDSIEQAAAARRERLRALKAAQELLSTPEDGSSQVEDKTNDEGEATEENPMKFRNYVPHDKHLQEGKIAPAHFVYVFYTSVRLPYFWLNLQDPFLNIAPKKPNWDLRRDVQKKLDKLEKRTQKALYKLMEEQEKQKLLTEGDDANVTAD
ncbi:coiled-coil domain-containing protein 12-like [Senna tora]|uniref:Coiled-coil domain-containing protein 12-like n=1 Tax=Senna tora TaxID=362788 RepID=A0A834T1A5_9FABA|nr:coiled-coil domain-containing protein 12-like [Senna tora]